MSNMKREIGQNEFDLPDVCPSDMSVDELGRYSEEDLRAAAKTGRRPIDAMVDRLGYIPDSKLLEWLDGKLLVPIELAPVATQWDADEASYRDTKARMEKDRKKDNDGVKRGYGLRGKGK